MLIILPSIAYAIILVSILLRSQQKKDNSLEITGTQDLQKPHLSQYFALRLILFILLVLHGYASYVDIFTEQGLVFGFAQALSLMAWVGVALYWIEAWFFPLGGMMGLVIFLAMVLSFLPAVFGGSIISTNTTHSPGFKLHFLTANIAYGVMFLAALHAILMSWQNRALKQHSLQEKPSLIQKIFLGVGSVWLDKLPSLLTMERVLFNTTSIGFILLTITVFSGIFFSQMLFGKPLIFDHKTFFALISWVMFGGLLFSRWKSGLRGIKAIRWVFGSFIVLLLAYIGSRFVLEVLLHRV
ncbi:MAG: cytochrome c biogenesis protein CcsA [Betaproteobacteria bacterium]|jgi:ABC-type uncharacterized transport system permease subunit